MANTTIHTDRTAVTAAITLNRPDVRNALNPEMIRELIQSLSRLSADPELRSIVIRGAGGTFSAGADLTWLRSGGSASEEENRAGSQLILELMQTISRVPVPVISFVEGSAYGGALGILGCSDWVFAETNARFAFSEVRLGLAPAIIMPYVIRRSANHRIKQLMLTGNSFSAQDAMEIGLVDQTGDRQEIADRLHELLGTLYGLPTSAVRAIKSHWNNILPEIPSSTGEQSVGLLTSLRSTNEARQLMDEFLNRKK